MKPWKLEDISQTLMFAYQEIDLVHCRISSIPSLRLERFQQVEVRSALQALPT